MPSFDLKYRMLSRVFPVAKPTASAVLLGLLLSGPSCRQKAQEPMVVLFCLDGATWRVIDDLRSKRKLPTFERLIRSGTSGPMQSLASKRIMIEDARREFASPILWTTIATGKVPEKHGVRDFLLPVPGSSRVWIGSEESPPRAELSMPEVAGEAPFKLNLRLRSHSPNGEQPVQLLFNEEPLGAIRVPTEWKDFSIPLPVELLRPAKNRLALIYSRQSRPADRGKSQDRRNLAGQLASLNVVDAGGETVVSLDPIFQRSSLGRGFYPPQADVTEVQSAHWRARPVWSLLGDLGHPVGIVGYWGTWPAYEVNGFLVSSRMGMRGWRQGTRTGLTWPPELGPSLQPLEPDAAEMEEILAGLGLYDCDPPLLKEDSVLEQILQQDELYFRIASKLLATLDRGFFAIYLESIDVASHRLLHLRHGATIRDGCPESVRDIVDRTYIQVDRWMGRLIEALPEHASVVVVSDHGMEPGQGRGQHYPYGVFIATGDGVRRAATFRGASVLDVAPTILQLFGAPIPLDIDGKALAQIFESTWLADHPLRYVDMDTSFTSDQETLTEGDEEVMERLRALGYIQ